MHKEVLFGGGCFWGLEVALSALYGVDEVWPGYAGGDMQYPTRRLVDSGITGHAEVVQVIYNPTIISFQKLLKAFFAAHDPSLENSGYRGLPGHQHASVIFCSTEDQKRIARAKIAKLRESKAFSKVPIRTEVYPMTEFWIAEPEDIAYYYFNGYRDKYCEKEIRPILRRFAREFWQDLNIPDEARNNSPFPESKHKKIDTT